MNKLAIIITKLAISKRFSYTIIICFRIAGIQSAEQFVGIMGSKYLLTPTSSYDVRWIGREVSVWDEQ